MARPAGGDDGGERGKEVAIAAGFWVSAAATVVFVAAFLEGRGPHVIGVALAVAFAGLAAGLGTWAKHFLPGGEPTGVRNPLASTDDVRRAFTAEFGQGEHAIGRRRLLLSSAIAAVAALGPALVLPFRALGPRPGRKPYVTHWSPGARLVTAEGETVRAEDLEAGSVLTVFPEGELGTEARADSQVVLIRLPGDADALRGARRDWAPEGFIAYSKVCTHAGCPVGLYEAETQQLVCPCHQSIFDVLDEAKPVFGPATRPLPQLPLRMGDDGVLEARRDFTEPVGPGFWDLP